ncbi:MAG TPA: signaling protein, partial [Janthinobacterium sp.]|nr:signaling protein [Janthinobacterium sp.]
MMNRAVDGKRTSWLRPGLETHISLPVSALVLLASIWIGAFHVIDAERDSARLVAADSLREQLDTYEAQVGRSLGVIEQTLKVLKYAVELHGPQGALPELKRKGLLPSGLVFSVGIVDRDGLTVASNPAAAPISVAEQAYFKFHQEHEGDTTFISQAIRDAANPDWRLHFTRRLSDADGAFAGIVIVETEPAYFTSSYERRRLGERGMLGVAGDDGVVRALRIGEKVSFGQRAGAFASAPSESGALRASPWDGVPRYSGVRALHGIGLSVMAGLAQDEQMAAFEQQRRAYLWEAAIASAVLVLIVALVWTWSWQGSKSRRRARRAQATYAAASEASLDAVFVLHGIVAGAATIADFRIVAANSRAEKLMGMGRQELYRETLCTLLPQLRENGIFDKLVHIAA